MGLTGFLLEDLTSVSYTHLRAHETGRNLVCRLLLEKKREYLFEEILALESQFFISGTELEIFRSISKKAKVLELTLDGEIKI